MKILFILMLMALQACSYVSYKRGDIEVTGFEIGTDKALADFSYESDAAKIAIGSLDQNQTNGLSAIVEGAVKGAVKGAKP